MDTPINPAQRALGYGPHDRVVIFHADDLGMGQATISAYHDLLEVGLLSSAAVMMPCAWASAAAKAVQAHPDADVGVHLTVTSEWDTCRWGPLTAEPNLQDAAGYFYKRVQDVWKNADPDAVKHEAEAQLQRAQALGLEVTHMDAHMGAVAHPKYAQAIVPVALSHGVPLMLPRFDSASWQATGLSADQAAQLMNLAAELEERGMPIVDHVRMLPLDHADNHEAATLQILRELPPGITHFILHPAQDTPELRATAHDWAARVANYRAFTNPALRQAVENLGIQVIGYCPLQQLWQQAIARGQA